MPDIFDPIPDGGEGEHKLDVVFLIDSSDGPIEFIDSWQQVLGSEVAVWEDYSAPCIPEFSINDLLTDFLRAFCPVPKYDHQNKVKNNVLAPLKETRPQGARGYRPWLFDPRHDTEPEVSAICRLRTAIHPKKLLYLA